MPQSSTCPEGASVSKVIDDDKRYVFQNYGRQPIVLVRGEGTRVWDEDGKEYLDFVGGLAVNVLGHAHPAVAEAVTSQVHTLIHTSNLYYTTPMVELARLLVENSKFDRALFVNSGTEAVEAAIKLARRWGTDQKNGAFEVISTIDGFHGRTMGALAATGTARYRDPFGPMVPGFTQVPWDNLDAIKAATTERTVAVIVEPVQGEGGVNVPSPGYLKGIQDWCRDQRILFIADEVQTGIGRTGKLFAYEHDDLEPDIISLAKGLAGGVPIGAILAKEAIAAHFVPGDHGSTFGGNPLAASAAVATLRYILANDVPAQAQRQSERIVARIHELEDRKQMVTGIRGRGLLLAVTLAADISADVVAAARERGLIVNNVRPNAVRLMPPLIVTDDEVDRACDILEQAIDAVVAAR